MSANTEAESATPSLSESFAYNCTLIHSKFPDEKETNSVAARL